MAALARVVPPEAVVVVAMAVDVVPATDCVDAIGEPLTADRRGQPRPVGDGCEVGAFERQPEDPSRERPMRLSFRRRLCNHELSRLFQGYGRCLSAPRWTHARATRKGRKASRPQPGLALGSSSASHQAPTDIYTGERLAMCGTAVGSAPSRVSTCRAVATGLPIASTCVASRSPLV